MWSFPGLRIFYLECADYVSRCWSKNCLRSLEWSHNSNRQLLFVLFIYRFLQTHGFNAVMAHV